MKIATAALAAEQTVLRVLQVLMLVAVVALNLLAELQLLALARHYRAAPVALKVTLVAVVVVVADIGVAVAAETITPALLAVAGLATFTHLLLRLPH
jgi:hypothetical protein